jgi:hypothetical protein
MIPPAGFRRGVRMPDHPAANRKKRRFPKQVPQWDLVWEFSVFLGLLNRQGDPVERSQNSIRMDL